MGASIGPRIELENEDGYIRSLKNVTAETKAYASGWKELQSSFGKGTSTWEKSQASASYLTKEIEVQQEKIKLLNDELAKVEPNSTKAFDIQDKINKAKTALNQMNTELKELPNHLEAIGQDWEALGDKFQSAGKSISRVGDTLMPISATAAAGLGAAVKTTSDFEQAMSEAWAVTGALDNRLDDLEKEEVFAKLEAQAREMGRTTKFTATESAEAIKYMGLAGWDAEGVIAGLPGVINLAAAANMDLATASDIVTDTLTAYGDAQEEATRYADVFAATMSNSNTTVELMGESLKYIAPVAGAMGYSFEDTALAIGLMGNAAIKGSTAGTTLRNLLTNMAKPTNEMAEAMDVLGVSLDDGHGHMYSFYEVMEQLRAGFGNLMIPADELNAQMAELEQQLEDGTITEDEYGEAVEKLAERAYGAEGALKAKEAAALGGKRAMSGLLAIVSASDEDFSRLTTNINESTGAAEQMRDVMMDNMAGDITLLKSELSELAIQFGEIMVPVLRDLIDIARGVIDGLSGMDEGTRKMIIKAGLFAAAVGPVLSVGGRLVSGIGTIVSGGGKLLQLIGGIAGGASSVATAAGSVAGAAGGVTTAIAGGGGLIAGLGSLAAAAAPFLIGGAVIAGVVAGGIYLYHHWDEVKEKAQFFGNAVKTTWSESLSAVEAAYNEHGGGIKGIAAATFEGLHQINESGLNLLNNLTGGKLDGIKQVWDDAHNKIMDITSHAWGSLKKTWDDSMSAIEKAYNDHGGGLKGIAAAAMEGIHQANEAGFNLLNNLTGGKLDGIKSLWDNTFHNIINNAFSWGSDILKNLGDGISSGIGWIKEKVSGVAQSIKDFLGFSEPSDGPLSDFHTYAPDMMDLYASGIQGNMSLVENALNSVGNSMLGIFRNLQDAGYGSGEGISGNLGDGMVAQMHRVTDAANNMKHSVLSSLANIANSAHNWGSDLANNMANGIQSAMGRATNAAASLAQKLSSYLHFSEPDVGPLSNFHTWMPDMMKQLASGIYNNMGQVDKAVNSLAERMVLSMPEMTLPDRTQNTTTITNGDLTVNVYGAEGQDVRELARIVQQEITFNMNRRSATYA